MSLPCHSCLDVCLHATWLWICFNRVFLAVTPVTELCEFLLACCEFVVCRFRLCFTNFHARRLQIIARMTEGSLPRAFRDVCQQTTLATSGRSIVTLYLPAHLRPPYRQFPQTSERNAANLLSKSLRLCSSLVARKKKLATYPLAESVWSSGRRLDMFKRDT